MKRDLRSLAAARRRFQGAGGGVAGTAEQWGFLPPSNVSGGGAPLPDCPRLTLPELAGVCQTQDTSEFRQVRGGRNAELGIGDIAHAGLCP